MPDVHHIFVTGGTGYLGHPMIVRLLERGHKVRALARAGSEGKLPAGCEAVVGNALDAASYEGEVSPCDTFVQLVGTPHPNPRKRAEFRRVDLAAGLAGIGAARRAKVEHFVYLSVAHPAPMMKAYIAVRSECEAAIGAAGLHATILRPWYVLGPGHRWPYALLPIYWLLEQIPATRASALRLGLVTQEQMIGALVGAVEQPGRGMRLVEVPAIRNARPAPLAIGAGAAW